MSGVDRVLTFGAAGALAATLFSFAAKTWWIFELFTHFRLQLFVVGAALAVGLLLRRRRLWALALGAAALVNGVPVAPYLGAIPTTHAAPSRGSIDVLSANVLWDNRSYQRLLEIIYARRPDVVVTVEFTPAWRKGLEPLDAQYPYRLLAARNDPYGVGVWSRYPLRGKAFALETATTVEALVSTPEGPVRLLALHLRSPTNPRKAAERDRQYRDLAVVTRREDLPLVAVGDFNTTPYSPYFRDWLAGSKLHDVRAGLDITWPTFLPILGIPIDHCVVNSKVAGASFERLAAFGSDHYPILCRVSLEDHR